MSKYKVTRKEIKERFNTILKVSYCNAQNLLNFENEFAYSTRAEGWACDYYNIDGVIISTGYAPIGKDTNYNLLREYDEQARTILSDYNIKWDDKPNQIKELLNEYIQAELNR